MPVKIDELNAIGTPEQRVRALVAKIKDGEALTMAEAVEESGASDSSVKRYATQNGWIFHAFDDGHRKAFIANEKTVAAWRKRSQT